MSRSYKKTPIIKDNKKSKKPQKKIANHRVRQTLKNSEDVIQEKGYYRKIYDGYDIFDYACYWSEKQARNEWKEDLNNQWRIFDKYKTENEFIEKVWRKDMQRK